MQAEGMTISQAAALLTVRLSEADAHPLISHGSNATPLADIREKLRGALLALDEGEANRILVDAFSRFPIESVCLDLFAPMLVEIGTGWSVGAVSIAQEHFASHWVRQKILGLLAATPQRSSGRPIITATAPTDQHEMGVLMVALFLQRAGWDVIHLGANLAPEGLRASLSEVRPALVAIAATHRESAQRIPDIAREIDAMSEPRPILGYGGQVFNHDADLRDRTPGVFLGQDAAEVVASVERLLRPLPH
jgi:methanogenic corrinoid protein MtbC1